MKRAVEAWRECRCFAKLHYGKRKEKKKKKEKKKAALRQPRKRKIFVVLTKLFM